MHILSVACVVGSCHRTTEGRFHSVGNLVLNTYLQDATIFNTRVTVG